MVLFRVRRVKSARLDDKRSYHRRGISIHPQRPDPSELPLRDHNAAPRKSMLGGAKLGHNIYLPIPRLQSWRGIRLRWYGHHSGLFEKIWDFCRAKTEILLIQMTQRVDR